MVEKDGLAFQVLLLCDHGLLADLVCDLVAELAFDHELANDVGIELEWRHGFGGGGGSEVQFMGGALFLRADWEEGLADVDALYGDWGSASGDMGGCSLGHRQSQTTVGDDLGTPRGRRASLRTCARSWRALAWTGRHLS